MNKRTSRPLFNDIRYFECEGLVEEGAYHHYTKDLYDVPVTAKARAVRLAALCWLRKVNIAKRSLYICFTPALPSGIVRPTEFRTEIWQRYVNCGLPLDFNSQPESARIDLIWRNTINCLKKIAPERGEDIEIAARIVEVGGEELEIPHLDKSNKRYRLELSYTIPTRPAVARLLLTVSEISTGRTGKCELLQGESSEECVFLAGTATMVDGNVLVYPRRSGWGQYYAKRSDISRFSVSIESLIQGARPVVFRSAYEYISNQPSA